MAQTRRRFPLAVAGVALSNVLFFAWLVTGFLGEFATLVVADLGTLVLAAFAGVTCLRRASREEGQRRRGWRLLGLSGLSWGLGEAIWSYYELVASVEVPFPSLADAGFLLAIPPAVAAMLSFFSPPVGWTSRLRLLVDALIVGSSMLFLSWIAVLGAVVGAGQGDLFTDAVALAYPAADVVLISAVILVGGRSRDSDRLPLTWISAGLLALAVSDIAFAYLTQKGDYSTGTLVDAGWFAGFAAWGLAALKPAGTSRPIVRRWRGERTLLPYVPVLVVLALVMLRVVTGESLDGFLLVNLCAVFLFVVVRQVLALRENHSLTSSLEAKVEARTLALQRSEQRLSSLVQNVSDVISVVRTDGRITYVSPSVTDVLGHAPSDLVGGDVLALLHPEDASTVVAFIEEAAGRGIATRRLEVRMRHRDGSWRHTETIGADMSSDPALGGLVLTTRDVTERKALEHQLAHQAFHDPLTELANRALFTNRVEHALARIGRTGRDLAVVFVDIDEFKSVNDALGHAPGDELLRLLADRLLHCVRAGDTVARFGGDEFAVLMEDATEAGATAAAERIHDALLAPFMIEGVEVRVSASVGIAVSGPETMSAAEVLRNADVAMYRAKATGKAHHQVFRPEMHEAVVRRVALLGELRDAIERQEFELHYQPVVELATGDVVGFEALVRWMHPTRGLVAPGEFISVAEETGLIVPLGEWVLEEAVRQLGAWNALAPDGRPLSMCVNVSGRQFQGAAFVPSVATVLSRSAVDPAHITLELTESMLLEDAEATIAKLRELKALGVRLAIDDFGTGFSSLAYLRRFPVDVIKIDKSFIDGIEAGRGAELTRAVVELGHVLELDTVAEGVETAAQTDLLRAAGCRFAQGFLFARPLPRAEAEAMALSLLLSPRVG